MEKKSAAALQWLDTAVKGVRFGPDRAAARAELEAHLEDKEADLRRIFPDMTAEEAEHILRDILEVSDALTQNPDATTDLVCIVVTEGETPASTPAE